MQMKKPVRRIASAQLQLIHMYVILNRQTAVKDLEILHLARQSGGQIRMTRRMKRGVTRRVGAERAPIRRSRQQDEDKEYPQ